MTSVTPLQTVLPSANVSVTSFGSGSSSQRTIASRNKNLSLIDGLWYFLYFRSEEDLPRNIDCLVAFLGSRIFTIIIGSCFLLLLKFFLHTIFKDE